MNNGKGAKAPQTNAERQAKLKKSRLAAGLVRVSVYATHAEKVRILEFLTQIRGKNDE